MLRRAQLCRRSLLGGLHLPLEPRLELLQLRRGELPRLRQLPRRRAPETAHLARRRLGRGAPLRPQRLLRRRALRHRRLVSRLLLVGGAPRSAQLLRRRLRRGAPFRPLPLRTRLHLGLCTLERRRHLLLGIPPRRRKLARCGLRRLSQRRLQRLLVRQRDAQRPLALLSRFPRGLQLCGGVRRPLRKLRPQRRFRGSELGPRRLRRLRRRRAVGFRRAPRRALVRQRGIRLGRHRRQLRFALLPLAPQLRHEGLALVLRLAPR